MIMSPAFLPLSPGMGEILVVLAALLLLFGADRLPAMARSIGKWLHQARRAADDFQDQLLDADRLSPFDPPDSDRQDDQPSSDEESVSGPEST